MNRKKTIIGVFAVWLFFIFLSILFLLTRYPGGISMQQTKASFDSLGILAPTAFLGLCILRGVTFLPCGILSALGGAVFGKLQGTLLTLFGLTGGSILTFYLARGIGTDWVKKVLGHRYDRYEGYISKDYSYSIFLMRVVPLLPYDVVSCIGGLSGVRLEKFILGTFGGSLPGVFIYVYFGDSLRSLSAKRVVFSVTLIAVFAVMPLLFKYLAKLKLKSSQ